MSSARAIERMGTIGLVIIAPLCLAIAQVREAMEFLGLPAAAAGTLSLVLLVLFLAFSLVGILIGYRCHRIRWPLPVGALSCLCILFFYISGFSALGGYLSCAGLITAGVANLIFRRRATGDESAQRQGDATAQAARTGRGVGGRVDTHCG